MKLVKIFGVVVAVHAVAFILIFVNPGCRSTVAPAPVAAAPAAPAGDATPVSFPTPAAPTAMGPDLNPATTAAAPTVAFTPGSALRASPTRPGTAAAESLKPVTPVAVTPAKTYTVVKGDSLWTVAKKNGITVSELTKANNLGPNTPLKLGQKLIISSRAATAAATGGTAAAAEAGAATTYTVKAGDTLAGIARRHGTTSAALKSLNSLRSGTVHAGQMLKLPAGGKPAAAAPSAPIAAPVTKPDGSLVHVIKPGETLGAIARKYKVSVGELATVNNISNPAQIRPGQELVVPGFKAVGGKSAAGTTTAGTNAAASAADAAPAAAPSAPPPPGQDLDAGLKAQPFEVPTIKIEDSSGTTKAP